MGRYFTWREVKRQQVPRIESFAEVSDMLRQELEASELVLGATLFGSVPRGDFNVRSDVDCAVVYDSLYEGRVLGALRIFAEAAMEKRVPINFTVCSSDVAKTRFHQMGGTLGIHLGQAEKMGGAIKGGVTPHLAEATTSEASVDSYLSTKLHTLTEACAILNVMTEEHRVNALKKAFEAPMHIARKMLMLRGPLPDDSKKEVLRLYGSCMPRHMFQDLEQLVTLDAGYTVALEEHLRNFNGKRYESMIEYYSALPFFRSIKFVEANIFYRNGKRAE